MCYVHRRRFDVDQVAENGAGLLVAVPQFSRDEYLLDDQSRTRSGNTSVAGRVLGQGAGTGVGRESGRRHGHNFGCQLFGAGTVSQVPRHRHQAILFTNGHALLVACFLHVRDSVTGSVHFLELHAKGQYDRIFSRHPAGRRFFARRRPDTQYSNFVQHFFFYSLPSTV